MMQCLTPRERDVAHLICTGASNKQIARQLTVSEGTIKVHLHRIYDKLAIPNRTMLALACAGMLPASAAANGCLKEQSRFKPAMRLDYSHRTSAA
jgi:DNA-binding CsgD family transcriptional regulator